MRAHLTSTNKITSFLLRILYPGQTNAATCFSKLQHVWSERSRSQCLRNTLLDIITFFKFHIDTDDIPLLVTNNNLPKFKLLLAKVAALRNIIRANRAVLESAHANDMIRLYEDNRCTNYADNKSAFINSSLNRSKRSIVLDRAMYTNGNQEIALETEPHKVKQLAKEHFKNVVSAPTSTARCTQDLPERWEMEYLPSDNIDSSIYNDILAPPTSEEWESAIRSLPNNKAAGISGIPYEFLKHLSNSASNFLKDIIATCFTNSIVPSQWKDATIYPIPKPHDWNCFLNNTRPICLLDTARKLMTRIMNSRLSSLLAQHHILQGNNFAGLPGSNCATPIKILEAIIQDANHNDKPLFIFLQDISKAFDSIDTNMLRLAMRRLKIPTNFIDLTIDLFTDRYNSVITAFGPSNYYKSHISIDQGETLSPLL
jgi:Reverse transcriptase (RNA-dependent DNA polymerase)